MDINRVTYLRELQYPCFNVRPTEMFKEDHPNWCLFSLDEPSEGEKSNIKGAKEDRISRFEIKKPLSSFTAVSYPVIVPFRPSILPNNPHNVKGEELDGTDWSVIPFTLFYKDFIKDKFQLHKFPKESEKYTAEEYIFADSFKKIVKDKKSVQPSEPKREKGKPKKGKPVFGESPILDGKLLQREFEWVKCWDERIRLGLELSIYSFKMADERASDLMYNEYDILRTNFKNELTSWDTLVIKNQFLFEICLQVYVAHHDKIAKKFKLEVEKERVRLEVELKDSSAEESYLKNEPSEETAKLRKLIAGKIRWTNIKNVLSDRILFYGSMWKHVFVNFVKFEPDLLPEIPEEPEKIKAVVAAFLLILREKFNELITNLHDSADSIMQNFVEYMKPENLNWEKLSEKLPQSALQHLEFKDL